VFAGATHPHIAQQPKPLVINAKAGGGRSPDPAGAAEAAHGR